MLSVCRCSRSGVKAMSRLSFLVSAEREVRVPALFSMQASRRRLVKRRLGGQACACRGLVPIESSAFKYPSSLIFFIW